MEARSRRLYIYEDVGGRRFFEEWIKNLKDPSTVRRIQARLAGVIAGNLGDVKSLGGGVVSRKVRRSYDEWVIESLKGDEKAQAEYVQSTIEENRGFPKAILVALRHVAEARGFKNFAEETRLNRETLYKTLSEQGNPTFETLLKMLGVLGLDIAVKPKSKKVG